MKQAQGFITDDGTFFESAEEATLHEAEERLRGALAVNVPQANADMFIDLVVVLKKELGDYINAADTYKRNKAQVEDREEAANGGAAEVLGHLGHVSSTEEDLASLLKLPARGPSHVPDVGSGARSEKVQDRREEHGSGVRGANASGVRSGKDMATEQGTKPRHARPDSRKTDIQKRKVERDLE